MSRRRFLQTSLLAGAGVATGVFEGGARALAQGKAPAIGRPPFRILMGGYGPPNTSFSLALKQIGEALKGIDLTKAATDPQALAKLQKITAQRSVGQACTIVCELTVPQGADSAEIYEALKPWDAAIDRLKAKSDLSDHYFRMLNNAGVIEVALNRMAADQVTFAAAKLLQFLQ